MNSLDAHLVHLAETLKAHIGDSIWKLGRVMANRGTFFVDIRAGTRTCTTKTYLNVLQGFADHWPSDLDWPSDIPRPSPTAAPKPKPKPEQEPAPEIPPKNNGLGDPAEPPPPGVLRVPDREAVRRSMAVEQRGLRGWAERRGYTPKFVQAVLSAYAGQAVDLDKVRSARRRMLLQQLCAHVGGGAARRALDVAMAAPDAPERWSQYGSEVGCAQK